MLDRNMYLVGVTGALLVLGLGFFFGVRDAADVRNFSGTLLAAEGDIVTLRGTFSPIPEPVPERFRAGRDFRFRVSDKTRILAISLELPPEDKLASASGRLQKFDLDELPRKEAPGSLEELRQLVGNGTVFVEAGFSSSILEKTEPVATSLIYRHLPVPDFGKL